MVVCLAGGLCVCGFFPLNQLQVMKGELFGRMLGGFSKELVHSAQ